MIEKLGTIRKVELGIEVSQHGINSLMITFECPEFTQGFGGYALDEVGSWVEQDLVRRLCEIYKVSELNELEGKPMIALYEYEHEHGQIVGMKNPETGATFTFPEWHERIKIMDRLKGVKEKQ